MNYYQSKYLMPPDSLAEFKQFLRKEFENYDEFHDVFLSVIPLAEAQIPVEYIHKFILSSVDRKECYEYNPVTLEVSNKLSFYPDIARKHLKEKFRMEEPFSKKPSFVFFGANATGKSHTALYLLSRIIASGYTGMNVQMRELCKIYNDGIYKSDAFALQVFRKILSVNCLVIDEVGKEGQTDNIIGMFEEVVKTRTTNNKMTIICCNLDMKYKTTNVIKKNEFEDRYGSSVFSSLMEHFRFIQFSKDTNFRQKERSGNE